MNEQENKSERLDAAVAAFGGMEVPRRPGDEGVLARMSGGRRLRLWLAGAIAAGVVIGVGVWVWRHDGEGAKEKPVVVLEKSKTNEPLSEGNLPKASRSDGGRALVEAENQARGAAPATERTNLGMRAAANRPLSRQVEEAAVILVGKATGSDVAPPKGGRGLTEYDVHYEVVRMIKGGIEKQFIDVRTPTPPGEFIGKEWFLLLGKNYIDGKDPYGSIVTIKMEQEIKDLIEGK